VNRLAATLTPEDRAGLVVFGAWPSLERRPAARLSVGTISAQVAPTGTDIGAAIALARDSLPGDGTGRIVLVTDGYDTAGDALREAELSTGRVRIDALAPPGAEERYLAVTRVSAPDIIRVDEPYVVAVDVRGLPGMRCEVRLQEHEGAPMGQTLVLARDGSATAIFARRDTAPGIRSFVATARTLANGRTDLVQNDAQGAGAVVAVVGLTRVLYVTDGPAMLSALLAANGFAVTTTRPGALPTRSNDIAQYDLVVLDDVSPRAVTSAATTALSVAVEQFGTGLLVLGSPDSLDMAAYGSGPLSRILPVDLRPRSGRRAPALGLAVVFDKSGSMADRVDGVSKIELARQSVARVLDVIPATDALGVIAFDSSPQVVAPLEAGHDAAALDTRLRGVEPSGSTAIAPAMRQAAAWLTGPAATAYTRRHVLLVSDGRTSDDDAAQLRASVAGTGIEVSVIALGADADRAMLEGLARSTGGRAYFPDDLRELPFLMAREAARVAGGTIVQEAFTLTAGAHPMLAGLDRSSLPRMGGYVVGVTRPTATAVLASHLQDPVLAAGTSGLGRTAVFTAALRSAWSSGFRAWNESPTLWVQAARWTSRRVDDQGLYITFARHGAFTRLVVDARDEEGRMLTALAGRALVRGPAGDTATQVLSQDAPGRYEATLASGAPGAYLVDVTLTESGSGREWRGLRGLHASADLERLTGGVNRQALEAIASVTGGRLLSAGDNPFLGPRPARYVGVWRWLTAAALAAFVGEILARRWRPGLGTATDAGRPRWPFTRNRYAA